MNLSNQDKKKISELLGRVPSLVETYIFDTMWSEHCSYKSTKEILKKYLPTQGKEVALGIGEDSGIIRFTKVDGKQYCIAISHESHNHPSQILPIEGAATGVGGVVRDVYCMGADVIGVLNSLHFGSDPEQKNSIVQEIAENVVIGVSDYANPLGVPVLGGETLYHSSYNENCLVNVAALGLIEESQIIRSRVPKEANEIPYDVILIGKSTDATGFGGASFASATLDSDNTAGNMGAVQVHDPFLKRVIVEALKQLFLYVSQHNIPIGLKDLGAGGISCAASEIAAAGGFGVEINLDLVPVTLENLPPEIISCSETQERFCLVSPQKNRDAILKIFNVDYELPKIYPNAGASVIGSIKKEPFFILTHQKKEVGRIPINAITTEVRAHREKKERPIGRDSDNVSAIRLSNDELFSLCKKIIADENGCSKRYVYRYFDQSVRGDTVVYPGEGDAVVITPIDGAYAALTVSMDSNMYGNHDPYVSGAYAVAEAVRNVVSVGGTPLAITDCLNYGNPENPNVFFDLEEGIKGIGDAARSLSFDPKEAIPVISGNVSLYNESKSGSAIVPSPVILVVGKLEDYRKTMTLQFKKTNSILIRIGKSEPQFGGTLISRIKGGLSEVAPQVYLQEENAQNQTIYELNQKKLILSCHDISSGGFWTALTEMVFGERGIGTIGAHLEIPPNDPFSFLFSENGGYVIEVDPKNSEHVQKILKKNNINFVQAGTATPESKITLSIQKKIIFSESIQNLSKAWNSKND